VCWLELGCAILNEGAKGERAEGAVEVLLKSGFALVRRERARCIPWWHGGMSDNIRPLGAQVRDWLDNFWPFLFVKGFGGMILFATIPPPLLIKQGGLARLAEHLY
jgi:hypothetical protein